jgi:hypothetical protein
MQSPDITSFVSDQANRNAPGDFAQRVGINTNRGPISYMPTPGTKEWTIGYQAGRTLPNAAISRGMLHPLRPIIDNLGTSNGASALAGAGIGGALGAGASLLNGGNVGRGTAVGAGMGATGMLLLSLFAQNRLKNTRWSQAPLPPQPGRVKEAFYAVQPEATQDIQSKVMQDGALAYMDKTTLLQYVNQLSVDQKMNFTFDRPGRRCWYRRGDRSLFARFGYWRHCIAGTDRRSGGASILRHAQRVRAVG